METTAKSNLPSKDGDAASKSETKPPDGGAKAQPSSSEPKTATSDAPSAAAGGSAPGTDTSPANEKTETAVAAPEEAATETTDPPREVFIAVMGGTGTGKSTFINQVTGKNLKAGHGLASCTQIIQIASTTINGQTVTLIDTPGFDEYGRGDAEILTLISIWLKRWHTQDKLLSGVIYLHRITDTRMTGASVRALILLQKMCGTKTYHNIALATTMWDTVVADAGEQRQKELKERYWEHILSGGGSIYRHDNKETSAKKIVMDLLPHESASLDIQDQMQVNPIISSTVAGGYAKEEMEKLLKLETEEIVKLKAGIEQGKASENVLREELARSKKIIEKMKEDMDRLNMKVMELEAAPNTGTITETQQTFFGKILEMIGAS